MFSPHRSFIEHTIAHADSELQPTHSTLSVGTEVTILDTGVIRFEPNTACDTSLVISCGIHGNETAPIEIASHIIDQLIAEDQKCAQRVLFIFGNPWAMDAAERFIDINMNRLFCGQWQHEDLSLKEVKRAAKLEAYVANFFAEEPVTVKNRIHYDCHTAIRTSQRERFGVYPFVPGRQLPASQITFLSNANIDAVLLQQKEATTFSSFSSLKQNAQSFTLELGKVCPFGENDLTRYKAIDTALRQFIADEQPESTDVNAVDQFVVCHEIIRTSEQWQFFVADDVSNFTTFKQGELISQDGSDEYRVQEAEEAIVFPNPNVPVGQRAGLMLKRI